MYSYGVEEEKRATHRRSSSTESDYAQYYNDEDEWDLDDAQHATTHTHHGRPYTHGPTFPGLSTEDNTMCPPYTPRGLAHPVIIPQRRPKHRDRGFIRAYAPDLMNCGIDQPTFMAFLEGFDRALAESATLGVINLAAEGAGVVPSFIAAGASLGIKVTAGVYQEMKGRKNQNNYLVRMNEELFRPRGLYCLVMAYNTRSKNFLEREEYGTEYGTMPPSQNNSQSQFRSDDGTVGAMEFPASAELVFPSLDEAIAKNQGVDGTPGSKFAKAIGKYSLRADLKAQAKYLKKNPNSALNPLMDPKVELTAKDLRKQEKRWEKFERKHEKEERKREKRDRKHPEKEPRKRKIRKGILYLMIVNMPSDEDMASAINVVEQQTRYGAT